MEVSFVRVTRPLQVNLDSPGPRSIGPPSEEKQTIRGTDQHGQPGKSVQERRRNRDSILIVRLERRAELPTPAVVALAAPAFTPEPALASGPITLAAGTHARLVLLQRLSASMNHAGDTLEARLVEPVLIGSKVVLPEGSIFEGHLVKRVPPRRFSRLGTLSLTFTKLTLPAGAETTIAASLVGVEVDKGTRIKMDSEGGLHGGKPGKVALLWNLVWAAGIAKITDDSAQLVLELLISGATDASTAGIARYVGAPRQRCSWRRAAGHDVDSSTILRNGCSIYSSCSALCRAGAINRQYLVNIVELDKFSSETSNRQ